MNKKEHKIWQEIKYDDYLSHGHIFSFEKQLKQQGKMVLDYIVHESEETYKTFQKLNINNNYNKEKEIIIESSLTYDNKNHHIWKYNDSYIDEDYLEALLYERDLLEEGKFILPYQDFTKVKLWN
jgi:hypothetical protein